MAARQRSGGRPPAEPGAPRLFDPSRVLLALDLGTKTGWALRWPDGAIQSGTQSFAPRRFEGGGMRYVRFRAWLQQMQQMAAGSGIGGIVFEEVRRHLGTDAAHVYGGLLATLTAWADGNQPAPIAYRGIPVQAIKAWATGKGNAPKDAVIAAMEARGFRPQDDNEADALAMLAGAARGEL